MPALVNSLDLRRTHHLTLRGKRNLVDHYPCHPNRRIQIYPAAQTRYRRCPVCSHRWVVNCLGEVMSGCYENVWEPLIGPLLEHQVGYWYSSRSGIGASVWMMQRDYRGKATPPQAI
jgi:hypothetical protein